MDALSKQSRRRREQLDTVNIQITFMSWLLEFISGWFIIVAILSTSETLRSYLAFADFTINFILIPGIYVMNNQVTKRIIAFESYLNGFRNIIHSANGHSTDNGIQGPAIVYNFRPIPTISGNIEILNHLDRIDYPCMLQNSWMLDNGCNMRSQDGHEENTRDEGSNSTEIVLISPMLTPHVSFERESRNLPTNTIHSGFNSLDICNLPGSVNLDTE